MFTSENKHVGIDPPPQKEYDGFTGSLSSSSQQNFVSYYKQQLQLWSRKQYWTEQWKAKQRSRERREARETARLVARGRVARDRTKLYKGRNNSKLTNSLNEFRFHVHKHLPDSAIYMNEGWPPKDAVLVARVRRVCTTDS